jgi:lysozyme family protein
MDAFTSAVEEVLKREGGYVNHPADRGGPTNFGITQSTLARYRGRKVSAAEVKAMSRDEAIQIYRKYYWNVNRLGEFPLAFALVARMVFDQSVNFGEDAAAKRLQAILAVTQDGDIGPKTLEALARANPRNVGYAYAKSSLRAYVSIVAAKPSQAVFIKGWAERALGLFDLAVIG